MWIKDLMTTMCHALSRYYFEDEFFHMRSQMPLTIKQTCHLMRESLDKAFHHSLLDTSLDEYDWVLKPHYYYVDQPYYNFPYIVGMISAMLIFEKIKGGLIKFGNLESVLSETGRLEQYVDFLSALDITPKDVSDFEFTKYL